MSDDPVTSYDEVPYSDSCFPYTHPDRIAAVATVYGLKPPRVATCRVLELGCALGGNLIPMAAGLPRGQFVGIDLSARQIEAADATARTLGLENLDLRAMSLTDLGPADGKFDYIICHGVYSWVPPAVQEKILAICSENLTEGGVAYISYNTYPGWHARGLVRELLTYHVRQRVEARERVHGAREFLDELLEVVADRDSSYARILKTEAELLRRAGDYYLFHEHLEETNQPCYFHEFAARAARHGLVCFAEARDGQAEHLTPEGTRALERWASGPVARQQYLDILCNRTFRRTLLCHEGAAPASAPDPAAVSRLAIRAAAQPVSDQVDERSDAVVEFRGDGGLSLSTNHPLLKSTLVALCDAWPRAVSLDELVHLVRARVGDGAGGLNDEAAAVLPGALLRCFLTGLVGLHVEPPSFAGVAGERPVANPMARLQAEAGSAEVANLRHRTVKLRDFDRLVLSLLDGRRDRAAILDRLVGMIGDGTFTIYREDQPVRDPAVIAELFTGEIEPSLQRLAGHALLLDG